MHLRHSKMKTKHFAFLLKTIAVFNCVYGGPIVPDLLQPKWFPEIIGGIPVSVIEANGVVSIQNREGNHLCSGILISFESVITASNCLVDTNSQLLHASDIRVIADATEIDDMKSEKHQIREVDNYILISETGIVILEIANAFDETTTLKYSKISSFIPNDKNACQVIGWSTSNSDIQLQTVNVNILNNELVNSAKPDRIIIGIPENNTCFGDRGSPLICDNTISGILTFGYGCDSINLSLFFYPIFDDDWITVRKGSKPGASKPSASKPGGSKPSKPVYYPPMHQGTSNNNSSNSISNKLSLGVLLFSFFQIYYVS